MVAFGMNRSTAVHGGHKLDVFLPFGIVFFVLGVGTLFRERWCATVAAVLFVIPGLADGFGSLLDHQMPLWAKIFNFVFSLSLLLPAYLAKVFWDPAGRVE